MIPLRLFTLFALCATLVASGCADRHGTHLIGKLSYEGDDAEIAKAVPALADPQVGKCAGDSTSVDSGGRGIKKNAEITPPYFVGLWPAAKPGAPEIHGRTDLPSIGKPLPGDQPFVKIVVCTLEAEDIDKSYDWKLEEQLDGEYYVGAWFDRDMNGYPGVDEPLGYYRDGTTGPAVTVRFTSDKAQKFDISIGTSVADPDTQAENLLANLALALQDQDLELFSAQFQPLYFKDPYNRTINQIEELYAGLVTGMNTLETVVGWQGDTKPKLTRGVASSAAIVVNQTRTPNEDLLRRDMEYQVNVLLAAGRDSIYQLTDWQVVVERSGEFTVVDKPSVTFAGDGDLSYRFDAPVSDKYWIGVEQFVPADDAPSGGTWYTLKAYPAFISMTVSDISFTVSPNTAGAGGISGVPLDSESMIRVTYIPVGGDFGYPQWADVGQAIEPDRGSYLRFYHYGANYVYRKPLPK